MYKFGWIVLFQMCIVGSILCILGWSYLSFAGPEWLVAMASASDRNGNTLNVVCLLCGVVNVIGIWVPLIILLPD